MPRYLLLLCCAFGVSAAEPSPADIVRQACERENKNLEIRRQYTYRETTVKREVGKNGEVKDQDTEVHEVFHFGGEQFKKLVSRNGQLLSDKEAAKEQGRLDKRIETHKNIDPDKARKNSEKQLRRDREFRSQVPLAFDYTLVAREPVAGRECYRIHGDPKPGYKPAGSDAKMLPKLRGDMWIDAETFEFARVAAETIDTFAVAGGIVRLAKGTSINMRQTFVNNEVWFPEQIDVKAKAKVLFFSATVDMAISFSDFKKFSVDSVVLVAEQ